MPITSPNSIKTCYIAEVLEEMGMPVKPAHNRLGKERRVKTPARLKPFIRQAIEDLLKEQGTCSYKAVQERVLSIIQSQQEESIVKRTKGLVAEVQDLAREIAHDESLFYAR